MIESSRSRAKIGLALAGGGPEGSIYEIGAVRALDECIEGIDFNDLLRIGIKFVEAEYIANIRVSGVTSARSLGIGDHLADQPFATLQGPEDPLQRERCLRYAIAELRGQQPFAKVLESQVAGRPQDQQQKPAAGGRPSRR